MSGVKRLSFFLLGETIGRGSFGKVKKAEHVITGHVVAVKIINREKVKKLDMVGKIKREIQILKLFRHPHIIKLYQVVSSPTDIFLIMEYVSGGELFDYILKKGKLSEKEGRRFFQQIISGVEYCHKHMVVHRDLKPENLLLDDKFNVKIADFGLSNIMTDGDFLKTSCGSPNYASPEVISGNLYAGPEVDVWSCGVILYVLLCGKLPFDDDFVPSLFRKIKRGVYAVPDFLSKDVVGLIAGMLTVDPLRRITIADIRVHPWFVIDMLPDLFLDDAEILKSRDYEPDVINEICVKFQVFREHVLEALAANDASNQIVIAYKLIINNKRMIAQGRTLSSAEEEVFRDELFGAAPVAPRPAITSSAASTPERPNKSKLIIPAPVPKISRDGKGAVRRSRWHLGMRSQNQPEHVMAEVYRAMHALNFQWKVITPYHVRCRCWNQVSGTMMKMDLQLYKADKKHYLLDFKHLPTREGDRLQAFLPSASDALEASPETEKERGSTSGNASGTSLHTLEFFELCAMIIAELGR